jgi:hypothetical protein
LYANAQSVVFQQLSEQLVPMDSGEDHKVVVAASSLA